MTDDRHGGQAFPTAEGETSNRVPGMTLRDWFAGQALIGLLCTRQEFVDGSQEIALRAGVMADAMLREREEAKGK